MGTVKFSAIIPTVDRPVLLRRALESALAQSYEGIEIIVVNNGNSDASGTNAAICEEFGVTCIVVPELGKSRACNVAIAASSGKYVSILDDDDLWKPDFAATLLPILDENPQIGALVCGKTVRNRLDMERPQQSYDGKLHSISLYDFLIGKMQIGPSVIMRREMYEQVDGMREEYPCLHDVDLYIRMMGAGCQFTLLGEALYLMTSDAGSKRNTAAAVVQADCLRRMLKSASQASTTACMMSEAQWRRVKSKWKYVGVTEPDYVKSMGFGTSSREARKAALLRGDLQGQVLAAVAPLKIAWRMTFWRARDAAVWLLKTMTGRKA